EVVRDAAGEPPDALLLLGLAETLSHRSPLADVTEDGDADHALARADEPRARLDEDLRAILAEREALPGPSVVDEHEVGHGRAALGRDQVQHRHSDVFRELVADHRRGLRVRVDDAVALDDRHPLVAGLGKAPEPLLAGLKSLLVASSLRRVPVGVADPLGGAAMIFPHATTSLLLLLLPHRVFRPLQALGSPLSERAARRQ